MVKKHARLLQLRLLCILWSFLLVLWIASELLLIYDFISFGADRLTLELYALTNVALGGYILFLLVWTLRRLRSWKRFEQQRQDAAQGQPTLLASEQPVSDASALSLPCTIIHRPAWFPFILQALILLIIVIGGSIIVLNAESAFFDAFLSGSPSIDVGYIMLIVLLIGYCIYLFRTSYAREYKRILITEDGLSVSGFLTFPRFIAWKDIRLLAVVAPFRNRLKQPIPQLEVSSAKAIVYWPWPGQTKSNNPYFRDPSDAAQEYEQQVYKALAVITARTGLPLYDLWQRR